MRAFSDRVTLQDAAAGTGNGAVIDCAGMVWCTIQVSGTFSATLTFEATNDTVNWVAVQATNTASGAVATTATAAGLYRINIAGYMRLRARVSTYASGNVTALAIAATVIDRTGDTMVGPFPIGVGDTQSIYVATTPQLLGVADGTAAAPDTTLGPLIKAERIMNIAEAAITGDGAEQLAVISAIAVGTVACEVQPVAIFAGAKTFSNAGAPGNDACPIISVGRAMSGATGVGIGAYFQGRRESNSGAYMGAEVRASNYGTADVAYSPTAFSGGNGIWLNADGSFDSAAGFTIGNPFGRQFEVGIAANAQVTSGKTGGIKTTFIQDDSNAVNSILVKGTHTIGLAIGAGAGYGVIGALARVSTTALWEVVGPAAGTDPLVQFGQASSAQTYSVVLRTGSAVSRWFMAGAANAIVTGTVAGDAGFAVPSGFAFFIGRAGPGASIITARNNAGASELGFFAPTTAAKQTVTGAKGSNAALGSLLTALAAYGLITDSTTA